MIPAEVTSEIIKTIIDKAKVGVNLLELEKTAEIAMTLRNVKSANKGYKPSWTKNPFPSVICLGVNDIIAHSPPYNYFLKDGDLLTIDCGIILDNMVGDAFVNFRGYVVNRILHGHGIGKQMHEEPLILNFDIGKEEIITIDKKGKKKYLYKAWDNIPSFYEGQIVCIEPYLTYKDQIGKRDSDGWTVRTRDGKKSAMIEAMVKVTSTGCEILTTHFNYNSL